ncbi:MAG: nucleotidyltransferase family protein [Pseudomonadota bacterium]
MTAMAHLVAALRNPASVAALDSDQWSALISVARAEVLLGTLATRVAEQPLPPEVMALLGAARIAADQAQVQALWEAEMCARALERFAVEWTHSTTRKSRSTEKPLPLGLRFVLLKGTAYAAAGLSCAAGRQIGDLDILVSRDRLDAVEAALRDAGWEWVKDDPYDQAYYRQYMHELPPLIHSTRDRMIDVHHTILPLTARVTPDATSMLVDAVVLGNGLAILSPTDMVIHSAAHMFADGDLAGGLRNLWDMHFLLSDFASRDTGFWLALTLQAQRHGLWSAVHRAARLAHDIYGCDIPSDWVARTISHERGDAVFVARILARDDWGRETRPFIRLVFYIRSHMLRMPPFMLAKHLWTKWRAR